MPLYERLLESGIRVLLYAGEADFICNWLGLETVALSLSWSGKQSFNLQKTYFHYSSSRVDWISRAHKNLAFVKIIDAGHFVSLSILTPLTFRPPCPNPPSLATSSTLGSTTTCLPHPTTTLEL
ncbi:hypothetical protein DSO57_1008500 [Entomophthora muscae]|uniref:Uncharacterized protein n=1 Tax=Entomophthora muscae TaxID=34485 RepID=A0ACC2THY0_9FUNG|nr:hypothetical protein DSO57_1008500 [Entomophthora muscae]